MILHQVKTVVSKISSGWSAPEGSGLFVASSGKEFFGVIVHPG
jgi:hypothetical protein